MRFGIMGGGGWLCAVLLSLSNPVALVRAAEAKAWSVASPDGYCALVVTLGATGDLRYRVTREGRVVLPDSPLGLRRTDQVFENGLQLQHAGVVGERREQYELFTGPQPRVDHVLNFRSLTFANTNQATIILDLAASDEGLAFRYRFPETNATERVLETELTGFAVPAQARGWLQPYHGASDYTPAYEDFYFHVAPGDLPPHSRGVPKGWSFPALFEVTEAKAWALITESGTDGSFAACHLAPDSSNGLYRVAFPFADEVTKRQKFAVGSEPRHTLPWTMPWRVIVLGKTAGEIATATLVTDLAPPSQIADTSWIRTGRASWAWWAYPDGPATPELFNQFTDFAARMGWEYTLFDAGWWGPGLPGIAQHAKERKVRPLAWLHASDFYDAGKRARKLDEMVAAGVQGVKVDFWCSDRQEAITAMHGLFREAAERKLVVNLHGCTLPRGWQRTWPNFVTAEAVLGTESYFYEARYPEKAAELNTVLPFTRNAVGPMDYTPVAGTIKKYARRTTAAHELACALIFTSGIIHFADKPEFFEALPAEALQILKDAPARWEETRCLVGEPGQAAVFARRAGKTWYLAGINGTGAARRVTLDLKPFKGFSKGVVVSEGTDAVSQVAVTSIANGGPWQHEMPARGGFILRLEP